MVNWNNIHKGHILQFKADNEGQPIGNIYNEKNKPRLFIILSCQEYNKQSKEFISVLPISMQNNLCSNFNATEPINKDDLDRGYIDQSFVLCDRPLRIKKNIQIIDREESKIKHDYLKKLLKRICSFIIYEDGVKLQKSPSSPCFICNR